MTGDPVDVFDVSPAGPDGASPPGWRADGARSGDARAAGARADGARAHGAVVSGAQASGPHGSGAAAAAAAPGHPPGRAKRRPAGGVRGGVPTVVAGIGAVAALLALVVAVGAWRHRARPTTTVRTVPAGAPVAVDAAGCPVADPCRMGTGSGTLYAAVLAWDPASVLVTGTDVRSAAGAALRSTLVAETSVTFPNASPLERARSLLTVVAQCVPGGAAVSPAVRADAARRVQSVTVPGRPGCSVTVTSEAEDGVAVPMESLNELAHRPGMQL